MPDDKILLATQKKAIADKAHDGNEIGTNMGADPDGDVSDAGDALLVNSDAIDAKIIARNTAEDAAKQLTGELKVQVGTESETIISAAEVGFDATKGILQVKNLDAIAADWEVEIPE